MKKINKNVLRKATPPLHNFFMRVEDPVILPTSNYWESKQTFNAGAIQLNGKIHLLYRAIGNDGISRLGYANSTDGEHIDERYPSPVYEHSASNIKYAFYSYTSGGSFCGAEDPRIVRVGKENKIYMTYTAVDNGLRVALTSIKINDFLDKKWEWEKPILISPRGEVHKNWVIFPEKIKGKYAILHSVSPKILIDYVDSLDDSSLCIYSNYDGLATQGWEKRIRGAGAPPIKTKYGWLLFYHAVGKDNIGYKIGAMLLDLKNPSKIICRSSKPVLEPKTYYETHGYKPGIVYTSGAVIKNNKIFLYYGASDNYLCLAKANLNNFINDLMRNKDVN